MAVRTLDSKGRLRVSNSPLLPAAFVAAGVLQGEREMLHSAHPMQALAAVAGIGTLDPGGAADLVQPACRALKAVVSSALARQSRL